jgi:NADH:ubiquinone oxidoreductase subunit 2 (subunit N)
MAALLVYALGTVAGIPGTVGFDARLDVARAAVDAGLDLLGLIVVASAAAGAAPLVRLALFFFAKDPPAARTRPAAASGQAAQAGRGWGAFDLLVPAFAVLVIAAAVLALWPAPFEELLRSARR